MINFEIYENEKENLSEITRDFVETCLIGRDVYVYQLGSTIPFTIATYPPIEDKYKELPNQSIVDYYKKIFDELENKNIITKPKFEIYEKETNNQTLFYIDIEVK